MKFLAAAFVVASFISSAFAQATSADGYAGQNGGCVGGYGGATTTVSSYAAFTSAAAKDDTARVIYISGTITLTSRVSIRSNKSIVGIGTTGGFATNGINISSQKNVIIRNLKFPSVSGNDAISILTSTNVWITNNHFEGDITKGVDYYDGQCDTTKGSSYITISYNRFWNHRKSNLVGGSPDNDSQDSGKLLMTYHHNWFDTTGTRTPALRFGKGHIYNNYFSNGLYQNVHSRSLGQLLVEGNVFYNCKEPLSTYGFVIPEDSPNSAATGDYERDGYANLGAANDWGGAAINITRTGTFTSVPYSYSLTALASVRCNVQASAGIPGTQSSTCSGSGGTTTSSMISSTSSSTSRSSSTVSSTRTSSSSSRITSSSSTRTSSTTSSSTRSSSTLATTTTTASSGATCAAYGQCGGSGWTGCTACPSGWTCTVSNEWYSQCISG